MQKAGFDTRLQQGTFPLEFQKASLGQSPLYIVITNSSDIA